MRLSGRVRSLERRTGVVGPCRVCGGRGHPDAVLEVDGRFTREPRGCMACGTLSSLKRIILDSHGDAEVAARFRAAWPPPPTDTGGGP